MELLRTLGPLVAAVLVALWADRTMERRALLPPRFVAGAADPVSGGAVASFDARLRRALGSGVLALILWGACFAPIATLGEPPPDTADLTIPRLFVLHGLLVVALAAWYALGHLPRLRDAEPNRVDLEPGTLSVTPTEPAVPRSGWRAAFALGGRPVHELAVGAGVGLAIWMGVLAALLLLAGLVSLLGGREALPQQPPTLVLWIGGLPVLARAAIALSAGLVEEVFFRGFLQLRIGVLASTALFALAHLGYGQPFLLVGVTLLSLLYGELLRRRGSVWAPISAHAVFDLVQLLVVVPLVAKALELQGGAGEVAAAVARAVAAF